MESFDTVKMTVFEMLKLSQVITFQKLKAKKFVNFHTVSSWHVGNYVFDLQ